MTLNGVMAVRFFCLISPNCDIWGQSRHSG